MLGCSLSIALLVGCGGADPPETAGYVFEPMLNVADVTVPDVSVGGAATSMVAEPGGLLVVFFGFTNCADVCPTTMLSIGLALERTEAPLVRAGMVTVDPARDTPEVLTSYVEQFVPDGLARRPESQADAEDVISQFGGRSEITQHSGHESGGSGPSVGHTSYAYVVDDTGDVALVWTSDMNADDMTSDLEVVSDRLYDT